MVVSNGHGKYCHGCESTLELAEFNIDRSRPDGRQSFCRACKKIYNHDRRWPGLLQRDAAQKRRNRWLAKIRNMPPGLSDSERREMRWIAVENALRADQPRYKWLDDILKAEEQTDGN
ncbi:MAG: hypothetical protein V3S55_09360 [Nitrospiraceae bacterium]